MCTVACVPVGVVWWFTEDILVLMGVHHDVAAAAGEFSRYSTPRLWLQCMYYCFKMYLSSQKIVGVDLVRGWDGGATRDTGTPGILCTEGKPLPQLVTPVH